MPRVLIDEHEAKDWMDSSLDGRDEQDVNVKTNKNVIARFI